MKRSSQKFSRRIRQFNHLSKQLNRLLESGKFQELSFAKQQKMIQKLKALYQKVQHFLAPVRLRKTLASAAIFLGLAVNAQAQNFADPVVNPFSLQTSTDVKFATLADIDNDGDLDLLTTTYDSQNYEARIEFYENIGTPDFPEFAAEPVMNPFGLDLNPVNTNNGFDFDVADMDNDGDLDMLVGVYGITNYAGGFVYYENTGTPESPDFAEGVSNPFGLGATYYIALPAIVDIDNDGDFDVFAGEYYGGVKYFENIGTPESPNFAAPVDNPFGINLLGGEYTYYVWFDMADIDGDGDIDLLGDSNDVDANVMTYQENIGTPENPQFDTPTSQNPMGFQVPNGYAFFSAMADLDDDGDTDVLLSGFDTNSYTNDWFYFENLDIINSAGDLLEDIEVQIMPNPTADILNIQANFEESFDNLIIQITDITGRSVFEERLSNISGAFNSQTNVSNYSSGMYFVKIQADGKIGTLRFLKK